MIAERKLFFFCSFHFCMHGILPPDMTVLEGSPCMALSTKAFTVSNLASFIKPELRMAPAPAAHTCVTFAACLAKRLL